MSMAMLGACVGYFATAVTLLGIYIVGNKHRYGFLICLSGEVLWAVRGWQTGLYELMIIGAAFSLMHIRNWFHWGNDQ